MNLAKQSVVSGKPQKPLLGCIRGSCHCCHCWELQSSRFPPVCEFILAGSFRSWPSLWHFGCFLVWLSFACFAEPAGQIQTSPFSVTSLEFLYTFGCGASTLCLIRDFFESRYCPCLPPLLSLPCSGKSKGRNPKWGKKGDHLNYHFQKGEE